MNGVPGAIGNTAAHLPPTALRSRTTVRHRLSSRWHVGAERFKQFFRLPDCYRKTRAIADCPKRGPALARDLLVWFFDFKTFPGHYGLSRLWEVDRADWKYYYGSNYNPHQKTKLKAFVEPLEYRMLFNDKYLCVLVCEALGIRVPRTRGTVDPAHDYRSAIASWLAQSPAGRLIVKPLWGEMGRDIVMAEPGDDGPVVRTPLGTVPLARFALREKSIVQDVLAQDPRVAAFSPSSVNTFRVVTMMTPRDEVLIVNASFRTGVGGAWVDNWSAGGVSVGVDCPKGTLKAFAYDKKSNRYAAHPTSGIVFEGFPVPEWEGIKATAAAIQSALPFYRLMGLDLALDRDGAPVLIEINGAPDLAGLEQKAGPLLKDPRVLRAFGEYGLLVNRHQRKAFAALPPEDGPGASRPSAFQGP